MENKKIKEYKGFSIFQKLLIPYLIAGIIVSVVATAGFYLREQKAKEAELKSQLSYSLERSSAYFNRTYAFQITEDLSFIEESYIFNYFLSAQKEEAFLSKTLAERLFLHYTNRSDGIYLSAIFINTKAMEDIITIGKKRVREYVDLNLSYQESRLNAELYFLFKQLKSASPGKVLCGEPFEYEGKFTFLAGIAKSDPEVGGFAGAVIFHCDLTDYFDQLRGRVLYGEHVATALKLNGEAMFSPQTRPSSRGPQDIFYSVSDTVRIGSDKQELFRIRFDISREIFRSELKDILLDLVGYMLLIIIFITFLTLVISRDFSAHLKALADSAKDFAAGNLSSRVKIKTEGELGLLVDRFNSMAENLQKTTVSRNALIKEIAKREEAEEIYKTVLRTSIDGFWVIDIQGRFLEVNDAYCRMIGYTGAELLEMRVPDVEAFESPEEIDQRIKKIIKTGSDRFETRHRRKDGSLIYIEASINYRKEEGGRFFVFLRDISGCKKAEERQALLLKDLDGINKVMVGRELRMIELKKEINRLSLELGRPAPFDESSLR